CAGGPRGIRSLRRADRRTGRAVRAADRAGRDERHFRGERHSRARAADQQTDVDTPLDLGRLFESLSRRRHHRVATDRRSYRPRGEPGSGCRMAFARAPLNSVISPAFLPGAGSSRAASGLFHLNASVAISPTIAAIAASLVSPGSGTVSTPPAHTAEYARIESRVYVPSVHRRVRMESSSTGIIRPEYPGC